jgi:hypothetical protein
MERKTMDKKKVTTEQLTVSPAVEWDAAERGLADLQKALALEISQLQTHTEIRNAYSPITWLKLCRSIKHATEGMAAVRLSVAGKTNAEISESTGIKPPRIGAFKAWNTIYRKAIARTITLRWRKQEERLADIAFLRAIGIAVEEGDND